MCCVDLGENFSRNIWLQTSTSMHLRRSPVKFARSPSTPFNLYYYTHVRPSLEDSEIDMLAFGEFSFGPDIITENHPGKADGLRKLFLLL